MFLQVENYLLFLDSPLFLTSRNSIYKCKSLRDHRTYIAKVYPRIQKLLNGQYSPSSNEIKIHQIINQDCEYSKYVAKLVEVLHFEDKDILIFERGCTDLFEFAKARRISEEHALMLFLHISRALLFLKKYRIVHLDIKPENIVLFKEKKLLIPKLIDFEFAKVLTNISTSSSFIVGTRESTDVNVLRQFEIYGVASYTLDCDVFSLAVAMYEILVQKIFVIKDSRKGKSLLGKEVVHKNPYIDHILRNVLVYDFPFKRPTLENIISILEFLLGR